MARPDALPNRLGDAAVVRLKTINAGPGVNQWGAAADPDKWSLVPQTVQRRLLMHIVTMGVFPAYAVEIGPWRDSPVFAGIHYPVFTIRTHVLVSGDADNAEQNLHDAVADAQTAYMGDESFGGLVRQFVEPFSCNPQDEIMLQSGLGIATLECGVECFFDHTTTNPT